MKDRADHWIELIHAGAPEFIPALLEDADADADCIEAARELGGYLKSDGQWRGELKRAKGWDGHANAWDALAAWIGANRPKDAGPWWHILEYANGDEVAPEVTAFFGSK